MELVSKRLTENNIKIGTTFIRKNTSRKDIETVIDIYTTYNSKNQIVKVVYVCEHDYLGTKVRDYEVPSSTIIRGLIKY